MDLSPTWCDPVNILIADSLRSLFILALLTIPAGYVLAAASTRHPLPCRFLALSRLCCALHTVLAIFFTLIGAALALEDPAAGAPMFGRTMATVAALGSGALAWTVVARRCRPEEPMPSFLS